MEDTAWREVYVEDAEGMSLQHRRCHPARSSGEKPEEATPEASQEAHAPTPRCANTVCSKNVLLQFLNEQRRT